jgi:hypothetical protein
MCAFIFTLLARQLHCPTPAPLAGQDNLSVDGDMMVLRTEGWKEVNVTAISEVCLLPTQVLREV